MSHSTFMINIGTQDMRIQHKAWVQMKSEAHYCSGVDGDLCPHLWPVARAWLPTLANLTRPSYTHLSPTSVTRWQPERMRYFSWGSVASSFFLLPPPLLPPSIPPVIAVLPPPPLQHPRGDSRGCCKEPRACAILWMAMSVTSTQPVRSTYSSRQKLWWRPSRL